MELHLSMNADFNPDTSTQAVIRVIDEALRPVGTVTIVFGAHENLAHKIVPNFAGSDLSHVVQAQVILEASKMLDSFFDGSSHPCAGTVIEV